MAEPARDLIANNPVQQEQVIAHIIAGRSVREIVEITGLPPDRLRRWMHHDEAFAAMFDEVAAEVRQNIRRELMSDLTAEIGAMIPDALDALRRGLASKTGYLNAASQVFRLAGVGMGPAKATGPSADALIRKHAGADAASDRPAAGD